MREFRTEGAASWGGGNQVIRRVAAVGAALVLVAGCQTTSEQAAKPVGSANSEIIAIRSSNPVTLFDAMNNPNTGGEVVVKATLTFPTDVPDDVKVPAMIFVHGSGGPQPRHRKWLNLFQDQGIATLYGDHFAPRGVTSTVSDQSSVTGQAMAVDALHFLNALADHPRIDPKRIGIMGASKGGGVAEFVAWNPFRKVIAKDNEFAAYIPLYPPCVFWDDKDFSRSPSLMMIGDKDNYTGVDYCVESVNELRAAGFSNMRVQLYPGAYHAFDDDRGLRSLDSAYSLVKCKIGMRADGVHYDMATGIPNDTVKRRNEFYRRCGERGGVMLGGNQVMPQAMEDVRAFVSDALLK